ncbi:beta-galactosidase [Paenibacillus koleovorans]|uniref:beta-galactosidase n=1 Tax=Paenibacillus koleovorans TaxID=121608 RepID=UPI000FD99286|nr:beta-galactosidase [Paenibacillus koleovorans]
MTNWKIADGLSDWSGYRSLQFTVFNPYPEPVIGGIEIWDRAAAASSELDYGNLVDRKRALLLGEGTTHVVIQIDPMQTQRGDRLLDLSHIEKVNLHFPLPDGSAEPLEISALRLSVLTDTPDECAGAVPGDTILYLKHQDISCYTYEPDHVKLPEDVLQLEQEVWAERERLLRAIDAAEINGKQTLYARAGLVAADIALKSRPLLAWHSSPGARRRNLSGALVELRKHRVPLEQLLSSRKHEDDEDDSNLPLHVVKPLPDLKSLRIEGRSFVDPSGAPFLICSMSYHNEGALMPFFAPEQHKMELYAVGGGSRYDIESSPVYEAFHTFEGTERVGWKGWCGHLIKDQWAMGGRKENVVICLENEHILAAIDTYNRDHAADWNNHPHLIYVILGYELTYLCYCEQSLQRFRTWLAERHGTIGRLNACWGTRYESFEEASPPPTEGLTPAGDANRAAWFDWSDWNTRRFTDHLKWSKQSVRRLHATMPISAGGTSIMLSPHNGTSGIDEEQIINEVDDVILHEGDDLLGIDLFNALSDRPKPMVDPEQGGDCSRWLLNYLHGKTAISKFWWPKQPSRQFPLSTLRSPAHGMHTIDKVADNLYTALDVRRLSKEIVSFWELPKEVALLYSKTNVLQVPPELMTASTTPYLKSLRESYEAARCLDTGITFVSERQLLEGKAQRFRLIMIPAAKYLPESVFSALDQYVRQGGKLLVLAESLTHDEYVRPRDYLQRWGIRIVSTVVPRVVVYGELEQRYDQNLEQTVTYSDGVDTMSVRTAAAVAGLKLGITGLFQHVDSDEADVMASDEQGRALLLKRQVGLGAVWAAMGTLRTDSLYALLDRLIDDAGIERELKVTDQTGQRVQGLEARLVRRKNDDLVYIANESGQPVEFRLETNRQVDEIRELRSLRYYDRPEGLVGDKETLLFSLRENPSRFGRGKQSS